MADRQVKIAASVMCIDWLAAGQQLQALESHGVDLLHWDVIDGAFAPDFTMGSSIINCFRAHSTMASDYHLMVEEPSRIFHAFQYSPGDILTVHQECCRNLHRDLIAVRKLGCRVGVAISPGTPIDVLEYVIEDVDVVLLMMVNPGYAGQQLVLQTLRKIEKLKRHILDLNLDTLIEVDGSVNTRYIADMVSAGADVLVGGSSGLFRRDVALDDAITQMREAIAVGLCRSS